MYFQKNGNEIHYYRKYEVPTYVNFPLFKYISQKNDTETKISMKVPVIMQQTEIDSSVNRTMLFIISSSKFSPPNQIPRANDVNIHIVEQSNACGLVCITFNMALSTEKMATKELRDDIELSSNPSDVLFLGYHHPYTIPYFRRNEICIPTINQQ